MLTQITQSVYISDFDSSNDRPRLGYIKGSRYNVMIDAGNSPAHFNDFIQECTKIGLPLPDFILLTHWHWDHVYGLSATKIPTICSQLTQDKLNNYAILDICKKYRPVNTNFSAVKVPPILDISRI